MSDFPFLTVVTRCYKRPYFLSQNIRSLKSQTDKDYEQVFIVDKIGHGLAAADVALNTYKHLNTGKYVMVLDDDDKVLDNEFISKLKNVIVSNSYPDIVIWRGMFGNLNYILPPLDTNWGKTVQHSKIGSFNYCILNSLYNKYINVCKTGIAGDYDFINTLLKKEKLNIIWIKDVMVSTQMKGKGRDIADVEIRGNHRILKKNHKNVDKYGRWK